MSSPGSAASDAKQCPWCERWCLKDAACNYIFSCGLETGGTFKVGAGCGKSWCWQCGKKFCGQYSNVVTGQKMSGAKDVHDGMCCRSEKGFSQDAYCPGDHNSHCAKRW